MKEQLQETAKTPHKEACLCEHSDLTLSQHYAYRLCDIEVGFTRPRHRWNRSIFHLHLDNSLSTMEKHDKGTKFYFTSIRSIIRAFLKTPPSVTSR